MPPPESLLARERKRFHQQLFDRLWWFDAGGVATNSDKDSEGSVAIAAHLLRALGGPKSGKRLAGQSAGKRLEEECTTFLQRTFLELAHLRPGTWEVKRPPSLKRKGSRGIAEYEQYSHLHHLREAAEGDKDLDAWLGRDYLIEPDVVVLRTPLEDDSINIDRKVVDAETAAHSPLRRANQDLQLLHAVVSTKWTMRSDRAQNARSEGLSLVRNRKGRLPHFVVVTGAPLPKRLQSLALGTGDVDCVYHVALPELQAAVEAEGDIDAKRDTRAMVEGQRLRDISDLPLDLAI